MKPRRKLNDKFDRQGARRTRDWHWNFMARLARRGIVHVNLWNKYNQKEWRNELRLCLISGLELMDWISSHRSWFGWGPHRHDRHTFPCWLTAKGRRALRARSRSHDRAPVLGGLVEPGYQAQPLDFHRNLREQIACRREALGLSRPDYIHHPPLVKPELVEQAPKRRRRRRGAVRELAA